VSDRTHAAFTPGRSGRADGAPGLIVRECVGQRLASLIARRGQAERASAAAARAFGVALPVAPRAVAGRGATFIWAGPGSWLVETGPELDDVEAFLGATFAGTASICDQSDSRVVLEVSGPRVRDVLAKGAPIDLHADQFSAGDVALTAIGHVGVHLRQVSAAPAFRLSVARSYFGTFWHWLSSSAAEFGCEVVAPDPQPARDAR
jgi:sarcosine oxidase subunit gamma